MKKSLTSQAMRSSNEGSQRVPFYTLLSDDEDDLVELVRKTSLNEPTPIVSQARIEPKPNDSQVIIEPRKAALSSEPQPANVSKEKPDENADSGDLKLGEGDEQFLLPACIAKILYPHQVEGIKWLWSLRMKKMGGILADDMGLGKTMQIASFLAGLLSSKLIKCALVVAPKTLLAQWTKEIAAVGLGKRTFSFAEVSANQREAALKRVLQRGGILLTTYDMVRCNWKALRGDLVGRDGYGDNSDAIVTWDYVILDEGHLIKNPTTERAKSLREIPCCYRIILSGTPIQNKIREMWALFDFCCEGLLGDRKDFKSKYETQILSGNDKHASDRQKRIGASVAQELRQRIAPFFLRRMKSEVFPENMGSGPVPKLSRKKDLIVWLKLTEYQQQLYCAFLNSRAVRQSLAGSNALAALSVLKKICGHPSLLTKRAADDVAQGMEGMLNGADFHAEEAMTAVLTGLVEGRAGKAKGPVSCKMAFLLTLLEELIDHGHRILVFSETRKLLNIIQEEIQKQRWQFLRIDGTLKSTERERNVLEFQANEEIPIFLLTSQVGGLGLTLTGADRVIIVDPAWNPSMDNQSVDRAYRIGQQKDVVVYRLITCATLEEKIYGKQVFKGGLMKMATETKNQLQYFSREELRQMFCIPDTGFEVSVTQQELAIEHGGDHGITGELEKHLSFVEGLSMVAGVSHHDLLFTKAGPALPPGDGDDLNVTWEPRNPIYNRRTYLPASNHPTYTYEEASTCRTGKSLPPIVDNYELARLAWLRACFLKDKIRRLSKTLEDNSMMSKLPDGGENILKKIKQLHLDLSKAELAASGYKENIVLQRPMDGNVNVSHQKEKFVQSEGVSGAPVVKPPLDAMKISLKPTLAENHASKDGGNGSEDIQSLFSKLKT